MKTLKKACWISLAATLAGTAVNGGRAAPPTNAPASPTFNAEAAMAYGHQAATVARRWSNA